MIFKSLYRGFVQLWMNKPILLIFYLTNFLFGVMLMLPFRSVVGNFIGYSLMGEQLGGRFNMDFVFEFLTYNKTFPPIFFGMFVFMFAVYSLWKIFLSAGALSIFLSENRFNSSLFWGESAKFFWRFVRLFIYSLPVFGILFCLQFLWTLLEWLVWGSDPYENIIYWGSWIKMLLRFISLILCAMIYDYARIYTVLTDEKRMITSIKHSIKFVFTHFFKTFGLAALLFIFGLIVLAIHNPLADILSAPSTFVIILLFIVQQIYMIWRKILGLTIYSSQIFLYKGLNPNNVFQNFI